MTINRTQKAFSMLEVVFVIVILGIVSSIGAEVVAKVYQSYHLQRASYRSSIKMDLAMAQIANRLTYAIPDTIIGRVSQTNPQFTSAQGMEVNSTFSYQVLQWIGYDVDSFNSLQPGWSGFVDVRSPTTTSTQISTPGSNLGTTNTIIKNLSANTKVLNSAVLFFPTEYDTTTVGYNGGGGANTTGLIFTTSAMNDRFFNLTDMSITNRTIHEHYKLAWSSYALVPMPPLSGKAGLYDLFLRYNFQPWNGESYSDTSSTHSQLLIQNISLFQFTASATTIRFKLCQREYLTEDFSINTCKEKAVIR